MASKVLVVGSGCQGLRTAIELLRKGSHVIVRSPRPPLHISTCSQGAGGYWMPFHCDDDRVVKWSRQTLDELLPKANTEEEPVEIVPAVAFHKQNHVYPVNTLPEWTQDTRLNFQAMSIEMLHWQNKIHGLRIPSQETLQEAGYDYSWLYFSPVVNAPKMLENMYKEVMMHPLAVDVNVETGKEFQSTEQMVEEAVQLGCDAVVNCTGLGARTLCQDNSLVGGRGAVLQYDRNCARRMFTDGDITMTKDVIMTTEEPPWGGETDPCYIIPRGDVIIVGGTYLEGDTEHAMRPEERARLEQNAHIFGIDTEKAKPTKEWVGFRPCRPSVRLEREEYEGMPLVHNYGHGGSGWTVYVGAAKEVASLLGRGD